ncbi:3,4-dihydroxy-2-butanone-4-phosphate synthase [Methanosalsum natronophilum]|uniref:3,4-dihydroxy-2-butanone-4-phosphate synthase n=1 Tax=Methanosalsum natronophilum TaxID=768733 RepID=UPI00216920CF|nr:3,4-dihydroxy-2-butanone-4-phosphate synthase [Methanosalsum natronophilum]MCS3923452.1 3,4-dihydroxy 2-butanone 4-phosphate synthase [Methanosalsum natronophilum]
MSVDEYIFAENVRKAIESFKAGNTILLFDMEGREEETDFAIPAEAVKPSDVRLMRKEGGGLICVSLDALAAEKLGLPLMSDLLISASEVDPSILKTIEKSGDLKYDSRSSFSLWVNHRKTRTGIPDNDRALTINEVANSVKKTLNAEPVDFGIEFRTPGHVALLRAAEGLTNERCGQTELSVALAHMSGITPAVAICEILDDHSGTALSKKKAIELSNKKEMVFVEGSEIVEAYETWKELNSY